MQTNQLPSAQLEPVVVPPTSSALPTSTTVPAQAARKTPPVSRSPSTHSRPRFAPLSEFRANTAGHPSSDDEMEDWEYQAYRIEGADPHQPDMVVRKKATNYIVQHLAKGKNDANYFAALLFLDQAICHVTDMNLAEHVSAAIGSDLPDASAKIPAPEPASRSPSPPKTTGRSASPKRQSKNGRSAMSGQARSADQAADAVPAHTDLKDRETYTDKLATRLKTYSAFLNYAIMRRPDPNFLDRVIRRSGLALPVMQQADLVQNLLAMYLGGYSLDQAVHMALGMANCPDFISRWLEDPYLAIAEAEKEKFQRALNRLVPTVVPPRGISSDDWEARRAEMWARIMHALNGNIVSISEDSGYLAVLAAMHNQIMHALNGNSTDTGAVLSNQPVAPAASVNPAPVMTATATAPVSIPSTPTEALAVISQPSLTAQPNPPTEQNAVNAISAAMNAGAKAVDSALGLAQSQAPATDIVNALSSVGIPVDNDIVKSAASIVDKAVSALGGLPGAVLTGLGLLCSKTLKDPVIGVIAARLLTQAYGAPGQWIQATEGLQTRDYNYRNMMRTIGKVDQASMVSQHDSAAWLSKFCAINWAALDTTGGGPGPYPRVLSGAVGGTMSSNKASQVALMTARYFITTAVAEYQTLWKGTNPGPFVQAARNTVQNYNIENMVKLTQMAGVSGDRMAASMARPLAVLLLLNSTFRAGFGNELSAAILGQYVKPDGPQTFDFNHYYPYHLNSGVIPGINAWMVGLTDFLNYAGGYTQNGNAQFQALVNNGAAWDKEVAIVPITTSMASNPSGLAVWTMMHMAYPFLLGQREVDFCDRNGRVYLDANDNTLGSGLYNRASLVQIDGPTSNVIYVVIDSMSNVAPIAVGPNNIAIPNNPPIGVAPINIGQAFHDVLNEAIIDPALAFCFTYWMSMYGSIEDFKDAMMFAAATQAAVTVPRYLDPEPQGGQHAGLWPVYGMTQAQQVTVGGAPNVATTTMTTPVVNGFMLNLGIKEPVHDNATRAHLADVINAAVSPTMVQLVKSDVFFAAPGQPIIPPTAPSTITLPRFSGIAAVAVAGKFWRPIAAITIANLQPASAQYNVDDLTILMAAFHSGFATRSGIPLGLVYPAIPLQAGGNAWQISFMQQYWSDVMQHFWKTIFLSETVMPIYLNNVNLNQGMEMFNDASLGDVQDLSTSAFVPWLDVCSIAGKRAWDDDHVRTAAPYLSQITLPQGQIVSALVQDFEQAKGAKLVEKFYSILNWMSSANQGQLAVINAVRVFSQQRNTPALALWLVMRASDDQDVFTTQINQSQVAYSSLIVRPHLTNVTGPVYVYYNGINLAMLQLAVTALSLYSSAGCRMGDLMNINPNSGQTLVTNMNAVNVPQPFQLFL